MLCILPLFRLFCEHATWEINTIEIVLGPPAQVLGQASYHYKAYI